MRFSRLVAGSVRKITQGCCKRGSALSCRQSRVCRSGDAARSSMMTSGLSVLECASKVSASGAAIQCISGQTLWSVGCSAFRSS